MKQPTFVLLLIFLSLVLLISSCKKIDSPSTQTFSSNSDVNTLLNMSIPNGFQFKTDQQLSINIIVLAPDNSPVYNNIVTILDKPIQSGGQVLFSGITDSNGKLSGNINLPTYMTQVVVNPSFPGIIQNAVVSIVDNTISCTLGGSNGYAGNVVPDLILGQRPASDISARTSQDDQPTLYFMGTFDNQGKPSYLVPSSAMSQQTLSYCNISFPEGQNEMLLNPQYFDTTKINTINVTKKCDVWVTFVSESATNKNSIAYFTYPTGTPPKSYNSITNLTVVLPNASLTGSGGELASGNKVKLGSFAAGTTVGFALVSNGWNGTTVGKGNNTYYTIDNLNPESQQNQKRHSVELYDGDDGSFFIGFEDQQRDLAGCDNDFNDVILNINSTPSAAISSNNVNLLNKTATPIISYKNYAPAQNTYGTLAFEDLWPYSGDYDMNDMVVEYNYTFNNNSQNQTVSINANYVLKAAGCYYHNGFGVQFPFTASNVKSVTGTKVTSSNLVTFASNGCESGQTNAVIIPFDNAFSVMNVNSGFNTYSSIPFITPDTIKMVITLNTPISAATLGTAPFNPFIFVNQTRGREVHLAGNLPTQKVDPSFFKTGQDNTTPSQNIYYTAKNNLPWALSFSGNFNYPVEGKSINTAYLKFISWAESGGKSNTNWFTDAANIVSSNVYSIK